MAKSRTTFLRPVKALLAGRARSSGNRARDQKRWRDAIEAYSKFLRVEPDAANIWVQLGHCLKESGNVEEAEKAYRKALELEPENPDTLLHVGRIKVSLNDPASAAQYFERAAALASPSLAAATELQALRRKPADDALSAADKARDEKRWAEAIEAYEAFLRLRPEEAKIWVQFGHCQRESGKADGAEKAYLKALELEPENPDTLLHLGRVRQAMNDQAAAIVYFQRAAAFRAPSADAREELRTLWLRRFADASTGDAAGEVANWLEDIDAHAATLGGGKEAANFWIQVGDQLRESGNTAEAEKAYLKALNLDPDVAGAAEIWIQFGGAWQRIPNEAKREAAGVWIRFGRVLMDRGDAAAAERAYRKAVGLDPDDVDALLALGRLMLSLNDVAAAEAYLGRASALSRPGSDAASALEDLRSQAVLALARGDDARQAGRWQEASEAYREFLEFRPTAANVWLQLGYCLLKSGDAAEAEKAYLKSWELDPKNPRHKLLIVSQQNPSLAAGKVLAALEYNERYYREHADAGLDYLNHGFWHESYAAMVTEATLQSTYSNPFVVDAGCACGSILKGFKNLPVYKRVLGVDLSEHMIRIGRRHFNYSDDELIAGSIANMPVETGSVSLVHSAQVLEHIPDELVDPILDEFARVLRPGGRAFLYLDAMRDGETKEMYMGDPTHVNIQPVLYWTKKLQTRGLLHDAEAYNRFAYSKRGPSEGDPRSFFKWYPQWSTWTLIRA